MKNKTKLLSLVLAAGFTAAANAQLIVFQENMGTPTGNTAIGSNTFENYTGGLSYSGTGTDVRATVVSNNAGASGGGNVFITNSAGTREFTIGNINTLGLSGLNLSFGAHKTTNASDMTELLVTAGAIPAHPTGSGTANWRSVTLATTTIAPSATASITWSQGGTAAQYRLDDVLLTATKMDRTVTTTANQVIGVTNGTTFGTALAETQFRLNSDLGGINTSADLLNLATTADRKLTTSFASSSAATNDLDRLSDVFNLTGTTTDAFVMQLSVDSLDSGAFLGWLDGSDAWTLATAGNSGSGSLAGSYTTGFSTFLSDNGGTFNAGTMLGAYGNDGSGNVWAVLDHNSSFAVAIPEPSSIVLLGLSALAAYGILRRRKK